MAIVDSGPIKIEVSLEQAVAMLIHKHGLEELVKKLFTEDIISALREKAAQQATTKEGE